MVWVSTWFKCITLIRFFSFFLGSIFKSAKLVQMGVEIKKIKILSSQLCMTWNLVIMAVLIHYWFQSLWRALKFWEILSILWAFIRCFSLISSNSEHCLNRIWKIRIMYGVARKSGLKTPVGNFEKVGLKTAVGNFEKVSWGNLL